MFSLESKQFLRVPTIYKCAIFNIKEKSTLNYHKSAAMLFCSKGLKKEFETAVVTEPSMFEPLKFCCILKQQFQYESTVVSEHTP